MVAIVAAEVLAASAGITCTLNSLPTSATRLVGRNATAIDLTALTGQPGIDVIIGGKFTLAAAGLAASLIEIWLACSENGTDYAGSCATTDNAQTFLAEQKSLMKQIASIPTNTTASGIYIPTPMSIAAQLGGSLPRKFSLFVTQSTGAAFAAAGNALTFSAVNYQSQ